MKKYSLTIKGNNKTWSLPLNLTPEQAKDLVDDGLQVEEILATYPCKKGDIDRLTGNNIVRFNK